MTETEIIEAANGLTIQRLLERHLAAPVDYATQKVAGATITVEPSRHRTGIPADATCRRYVITHIAEGWSMVVRAVWRDGRLHRPAAVHTRIDRYLDDDGRYGDNEAAVAAAANGWLRNFLL